MCRSNMCTSNPILHFIPGACDSESNCKCSEKDVNVLDSIKSSASTFVDEVKSWEIEKTVREAMPSRCLLGDE
jgi:glutaredoxin-related protein